MLHQCSVRRACVLLLLGALLFRLADAACGRAQPGGAAPQAVAQTVSYPALAYTPPQRQTPLFCAGDAQCLEVENSAGAVFDAAALLTADLQLDGGTTDAPRVLIVHTHATEAYAGSADYRSTDTAQNVVRVGQALAQALRAQGIAALHDTTLNDLEGYSDAYERIETRICDYLARWPSIRLVIDVHRDAAQNNAGEQVALCAQVDGARTARLLLVMGTEQGGLPYPGWQDNLALGLKLQCLGTRETPGLFRALTLRSARYNQHLCAYSLLLEVGAAGNTLEEAVRSAELFAQLLARLLKGA